MKAAAITVASLLAAFIVVTLWALESGDVAVITTHPADGRPRSTRVWYTHEDGELWLEAGAPENPWFLDVQRDPRIDFAADDHSGSYRAWPVQTLTARTRIRALLREKYGLRDWWVGLVVDSSRSLAVRLVPADADPHREP